MRPRAGCTIVLALSILAIFAREGTAQNGSEPRRLASAGVYSTTQAARGRETYAAACQGCHTPASHTGVAFRTGWGGRLLSELFAYLVERMPKNEPGTLAREEYVDLTAYLLLLNGMPAGQEELPADTVILRTIRIDSTTKSP